MSEVEQLQDALKTVRELREYDQRRIKELEDLLRKLREHYPSMKFPSDLNL